MNLFLSIIMSSLLLLGIGGAENKEKPATHTLTIIVNNVKDSSGSVGVALFDDSSEFPDGESFMDGGKSLSSGGSIEVVLENVPEGDYALVAIHDANDNMDIDMNDQGMPIEGFGFSNGAMGEMGPPDFKEAAFTVDEDMEIEINLIYLLGRK